jgi:hypothetical protein
LINRLHFGALGFKSLRLDHHNQICRRELFKIALNKFRLELFH